MNSRPHAGSLHRLPSPASAYLTPDGIAARVEELRAAHGGRTFPIGSTREGRQILATSFGSAEPGHEQGGVLLLSLLHAYEWIGALTLLRLLERLLRVRASASHPPAPLVAVPIANPDGAAAAEEAARALRLRMLRGNAAGIDLNRNFPANHRARGPWTGLPWWRPGPFPTSEPETAALVALASERRPRLSFSFHSFGRWFFYPPAGSRRPTPSAAAHRALLDAAGGAGSIGYRAGQLGRWSALFRAPGAEIDFLSQEEGSFAYLIEVSGGGMGRWGVRRLGVPFFAYNPCDPEPEAERVARFCERIVRIAIPVYGV